MAPQGCRPSTQVRIGNELTDVRRHLMVAAEVAFVLETTVQDVRRQIRVGLLPVRHCGRVLRVDAIQLAASMDHRGDLLGVEFIRAWTEGRFDAPRAAKDDQLPPRLLDRLPVLSAVPEDRTRGP